MGMSLSACKGPTETPSRTPTPTPSPDIPLGTQTSDGSVTITVKPTGDSGQGTPTPSANCTLTLTPTNKPTPTLTDDELFQITAEEIQLAGGIINVLKNEDTSLLLARVAIGEAQDREDERLRIMWLVKVRAELGYSNSVRGINTSFLDRFGVKSTVESELLEPGEFEVIDYIRDQNISNPQLEPDSNIKAMLYPTGEKN